MYIWTNQTFHRKRFQKNHQYYCAYVFKRNRKIHQSKSAYLYLNVQSSFEPMLFM